MLQVGATVQQGHNDAASCNVTSGTPPHFRRVDMFYAPGSVLQKQWCFRVGRDVLNLFEPGQVVCSGSRHFETDHIGDPKPLYVPDKPVRLEGFNYGHDF